MLYLRGGLIATDKNFANRSDMGLSSGCLVNTLFTCCTISSSAPAVARCSLRCSSQSAKALLGVDPQPKTPACGSGPSRAQNESPSLNIIGCNNWAAPDRGTLITDDGSMCICFITEKQSAEK